MVNANAPLLRRGAFHAHMVRYASKYSCNDLFSVGYIKSQLDDDVALAEALGTNWTCVQTYTGDNLNVTRYDTIGWAMMTTFDITNLEGWRQKLRTAQLTTGHGIWAYYVVSAPARRRRRAAARTRDRSCRTPNDRRRAATGWSWPSSSWRSAILARRAACAVEKGGSVPTRRRPRHALSFLLVSR